MFAIIISWIAISIVFLSFGDFFVFLYNKLSKCDEKYEITDTFLLGMCCTLIPLSFTSLWLPSNQYILALFLVLSFTYWLLRKKHFYSEIHRIKASLKALSVFQTIAFVIPALSLMLAILWQIGVFDSLFYHQQNIRWNEEYAVVPGLGNLEHRFAFNSNYLLLSAIFSFRFLFGEAVYSLHVLVLVYVIFWILKDIIKSGYETKRITLLVILTGFIFIFGFTLTATSTDAIPNIISFYLIAQLLLYPDSLREKTLLYIVVPIALTTFKLTIIPLSLLSLYSTIFLIKQKNYKAFLYSLAASSIIVILWLTRNVFISGYLIFPFSEIDLFAVDWKIPKYVAVEERDFILSCGVRIFNDIINHLFSINFSADYIKNWLMNFIFVGSAFISPVVVIYSLFRRKFINKMVYFVYVILLAIFAIWYVGGPDPRFIGGTLFAFNYYILFIILSTEKEKHFRKTGTIVVASFILIMGLWPITRTIRFSKMFNLSTQKENMRPVFNILWRQYPYRELLRSAGFYKNDFETYKMSKDISIYISKSPEVPNGRFVCFENPFPCTVFSTDEPTKYQDILNIEPRGNSLQDGFRPKTNTAQH